MRSIFKGLCQEKTGEQTMSNYLIAGISLAFDYQYDDFFKNNIEKYLVEDAKPSYSLSVKTVEYIEEPKVNKLYDYKNRSIFSDDDYRYVVSYHDGNKIKLLMKYRHDYSDYQIYLTNVYGDRLAEMEYVLSGLAFMVMALKENRLSLHASAIAVNGLGVLFAGASGTGKSTHVKNWKKIGVDFEVINDDKPLIYKENGLFYVSGSPWSGKEVVNSNIKVPLYAIVFLEQGINNEIVNLDKQEMVKELLKNCLRPEDVDLYQEVLSIIEDLIDASIIIKLKATIDTGSALFLHNILF